LLLTSAFGPVEATPDLIGFSGAPGTHGSCAIHCHGTTGGTIVVSGFPSAYQPGDTYIVYVGHDGGSAISNFNASVRIGSGPGIAGALLHGLNTEAYSVPDAESVGVHFVAFNQDSGYFRWIAPGPGTGNVTLYLAGMQGPHITGPNTTIAQTAVESPVGIADASPATMPALTLLNRIVTDYLVLQVDVPNDARAVLTVLSQTGSRVAVIQVPTGGQRQTILWQPVNARGRRLAPGSYFVSLSANHRRITRKFILSVPGS
jgi:hypothetical protein